MRPSVSVVGEAQIEVSPDQVVFTLEVVTVNKDVTIAKRSNDIASAKMLAVTKGFQIDPQDVQTDSLTISPKYTSSKDPRGENILTGYEVKNRLLVTLKDLTKIDGFLSKAIEAGVNRVVSIEIENSEMQKHRERARALAVTNAENKAEDADQPGIVTGYGSGDGSGSGNGVNAEWAEPQSPFARQVTFALGQITIEEKIYVTFKLNR